MCFIMCVMCMCVIISCKLVKSVKKMQNQLPGPFLGLSPSGLAKRERRSQTEPFSWQSSPASGVELAAVGQGRPLGAEGVGDLQPGNPLEHLWVMTVAPVVT